MSVSKIHVTGGPASGKTTLSKQVAASLRFPLFELDGIALQLQAVGKPFVEMTGEAQRIALLDYWVSEGAYMEWAEPLFQQADVILWLDVPWRGASYRIISRHIRATIARNNRFPGWRRLFRFWRWSRRYYQSLADLGLNPYGVPNTRRTALFLLAPYKAKLTICRSNEEIRVFLAQLFKGVDS